MKGKLLVALLVAFIAVPVLSAQIQPNVENGWKPYGSYDGSHLDTVNVMNGNLMFHAPLLPDLPERGGLAVSYTLSSTGKTWQVQCTANSDSPTGRSCYWRLGGMGVMIQRTPNLQVHRTIEELGDGTGNISFEAFGYTIITPDQATHEVLGVAGTEDASGRPTKYNSTDTSGFHLELSNPNDYNLDNTATVTDRHGTIYQAEFHDYLDCVHVLPHNQLPKAGNVAPIIDDAPLGDTSCPQIAFVKPVIDANGNQVINVNLDTIGNSTPQIPLPATDTLARTLPPVGGTATDSSQCVSRFAISQTQPFAYSTPQGTQQAKLCYSEIPIQTAFNQTLSDGTPVGEGVTGLQSLHFIAIVTLIQPDGTKWVFDYDSYGELTYVGLPTGGSISYTWQTISFANCDITNNTHVSRAVRTRTLNDGQSHISTWQYNWGAASATNLSNSVIDPAGNETVHQFTSLGSTAVGCNLYETSTTSYQGAASLNKPLTRVDTGYFSEAVGSDTGTFGIGTGLGNVFATDVTTTVYSNGTPVKVKLVHRDPDRGLGPGLPIFGNTIRELDYDWGAYPSHGPLLRETDTTYEWQINPAYLSAGLLDLPAYVSVIDPVLGASNKPDCHGWDANLHAATKPCALETAYGYDEYPLQGNDGGIPANTLLAPSGVRGNQTSVSEWLAPGNAWVSSHTHWYDTGEPYQKSDPLGHTTTFTYSSAFAGAYLTQTCSPQTGTVTHCVSGAYDFNTGVLTSFTDQNQLTSNYGYDLMFHLVSAQGPPDPNNGNARPTDSFQYSTTSTPGVFPITVTHLKSITSSSTDSATTTYDGLGRIIKTQHATPAGTATVDTSYDLLGRAATVSNPYFTTGDATYGITQTVYDGLDRPILVQKPDNSYSTVAYQGDCTVTEDEAGKARRTCTDALGRLTEVEEPGDTSAPAASDAPATSTSATAIVTISGAEQVITSPPVKCPPPPQTCDQTSDPPIYDSGSVSVTVNGHTTSRGFGQGDTASTVASNLANAINNDTASPVSAAVNGQQITLTAKTAGQGGDYTASFSSTWDSADFTRTSFGGMVSSFRLLGGEDLNSFAHVYTTLYQYDVFGNMLCVEQHGNTSGTGCSAASSSDATSPWRVRRFTYDSFSRLLTAHNPESGTITYTYDADGNLTTKTDARGVITNFSPADSPIDALHRVTKKTYSDGTPAVVYGYDSGCCDVDPKYGVGRLTYESSGNTELVFVYDVMGHITTQADCPPSGIARGFCYGIGATYDLAGNQRSLIYPDARIVTFNYNGASQLNQVQFSSFNGTSVGYNYWSVADANFLPTGVPATVTLGNGDTETQRFNNRLQLSEKLLTGAGSMGTLADHVFNYGALNNGNVMSVTDQLNSAYTQTYSYDQLNRLLTANESRWGMGYVYDAWGNYLQQNQTGGTTYQHQYLADVTNRLTGYSYDLAGNMLADSSHQYAYDAESRIKSVDSTAASYTYNPEGNRVRKDVGSNSTEYFYFGGHVIAELDPANGWSDYIYANGQRIAKADAFFHEIDIGGTNSTNTQYTTFAFTNAGTLIGYVIRPGDKFYFWQYEWPGTEAGMRITFTDASSTNWIAVDQYGNYMNAGIAAGGTRIVDLSGFAGKQVSALDLTSAVGTAAGNWASSFHDIALVSADGTVIPIYNGEATNPTVIGLTNGATGQSTVVSNSPGRYDPNFSTMYYHDDQLGTSRMMTSHSGYPIWQGTFLPYGEEYNPQMTMNHFKFTGKERDSESQLDYFGARYYGSALGRFITPDWETSAADVPYAEFADPQSLNLYSYVRDLPTAMADIDGHQGPHGENDFGPNGETDFGPICHFCMDGPMWLLNKILPGNAISAAYFQSSQNKTPPPPPATPSNGSQTAQSTPADPNQHKPDQEQQNKQNQQSSKSKSSVEKSIQSLEKRIEEHEQKLADYKANPDAHDNQGILKNASPDQRQRIIDGRIRHLQKEIDTFKKTVEQLRQQEQEE